MQTTPFIEASREIRGRFYHLIDSLSALRGLTEIETRYQPENLLLTRAIDQLLEYEDFSHCMVHRFRDGVIEPSAERSRDLPDGEPADIDEAHARLIADCAQMRHPVRWDDCERESRDLGLPLMTGTLMCIPLVSRGDLLGVLSVRENRPNAVAPWQEHALMLFCNVLGSMLDNNRLLNDMEQAVKNRTRQLEVALREAEQLKMRYEQLSNVDELTALHNRRFFFPETEAALARAVRYQHTFSLILADVDMFKNINDTHGHAMGDQVLRDIAEELRRQTRDGDIIARFGGEEFAIALPNTDLDGARLLASRVRASVAALGWETVDGETFRATISLGVTGLEGREHRDTRALLEEMLREADQSLYDAKSDGRNSVRVFSGQSEPGGEDADPKT